MNLISESYRAQNAKLHENPAYGVSGAKHFSVVEQLAAVLATRDILDYGCGKRTLQTALGFQIHNYDPCIPGFDNDPAPADLVVCSDVLEHIEPEYLDNVLDDLQRVTKRAVFLVIANRPAKKVLPDGRNAHLIQESGAWWIPKIMARFRIKNFSDQGGEMYFICEKP